MSIIRCLLLIVLFVYSCKQDKSQLHQGEGFISLSPHITEIVYAIGGENQLAGITDFCDYPPAAAEKARIGGLLNPNIEKIISLKPAFLIGLPSHRDLASKLSPYGLDIHILPNETIDDVLLTIDSVGVLTGRAQAAAELTSRLRESLYPAAQKPHDAARAMLVIGRTEGTPRNITVAGPGTFIHEIWERAGGRNLFADLSTRYSIVSREAIMTRNPEVILEFRPLPDATKEQVARLKSEWNTLGAVEAVRKGHVFILTNRAYLIPGPRMMLLGRKCKEIIGGLRH